MRGDATDPLTFVVDAAGARQRIDVWLAGVLAAAGIDVTRSSLKQWIEQGSVLVDGRTVKPSARACVGARIVVHPAPPPGSDAMPDPTIPLSILHEDDDLIVVDKPAGLVVHPARGHESGTLVNALLAHATIEQESPEPGDDAVARPGIVHRLDKDTSGVMVVARTARAREGLKALFSRHDIEREYRAVVVGSARDATYDTPFGRHPADRLKFSTKARGATRRAVTHVRVLERLAGGRATLVACTLETGRTHQIRVHLSECGHTPVLGDKLYGGRVRDRELAEIVSRLDRHWLHAAVLGFVHPVTGARMRFESMLPESLVSALEALRRLGSTSAGDVAGG